MSETISMSELLGAIDKLKELEKKVDKFGDIAQENREKNFVDNRPHLKALMHDLRVWIVKTEDFLDEPFNSDSDSDPDQG